MKFFLITTLTILALFLLAPSVHAQQNAQIILTWQANSFYPSDYPGKAWASPNNIISISVETLRNNKFLNLSEVNIIWYLDDNFLQRGVGLKEISFVVKKTELDHHFVRAVVQLNKETAESAIRIPIYKQSAVFNIPYPLKTVSGGSQINLQIIPYFFNIPTIENLIFSNQINENKYKNEGFNQINLNIGTPQIESQKIINLYTLVYNKNNPLEFSQAREKIIIK